MRISTILCSPNILRELSKEHSVIGASQYQQPLSRASPCRHFPRRSLTSIVIVPLAYRQTFCRHNAISSAPTHTNESINPGYSTPNGSSLKKSQPKNRRSQKHLSRIRRESNCSHRPCARLTLHSGAGTNYRKSCDSLPTSCSCRSGLISRVLIKTTLSEFCTSPSIIRKYSSVIKSRSRLNKSLSTIAFETPVSSSKLMYTNPCAMPLR